MMVKDYLLAHYPAVFNGWGFKFGQLVDAPNQQIVLIDQGDRAGFPHLLVDYLGLQILVRGDKGGNGYQVGYLKMREVRDILLGMTGHPDEFVELDGITERAPPVPLGNDDKDRHTWSWNVRLLVEPLTNALTNRESL